MIKVLNIISDSNIGGAGRCVLNFLKYYDRSRFTISVVVPVGSLLKAEIEKLDTPVIEAKGIAEKSFDKNAVGVLNKIIKSENPDIVHTHGNLTGRISAKICGKKIIYTRHSVFPVSRKISRNPGKLLNKIVNEFLSDDIIAVAEAAKDNLTQGGISPKKIKVILNGVEQVTPCSLEENTATKRKYGISDDDFVIGILARIEAVKGHEYLIEAAEKCVEQGKKIKVLIAGTGEREEELKKLVIQKGLDSVIVFTGFISDVRKILSIFDIQVNTSYGTEATSLALLEGMSMGIPAVVSNYGGNPGVITHGVNGYLFESRNSGDLASYILKIMGDKEIYHLMKKNALSLFHEKFTAEIYARNIESVYESVIKGK